MSTATLEAYVKDLSSHPISISGDTFAKNFIQVVKQVDNEEVSVKHLFYSIDDDGVVNPLASINVSQDFTTQKKGISFNVVDDLGAMTSVLDLTPEGVSVNGGIEVVGGSTTFETSTIVVADYDIVLGSGATLMSQLDQGGIILGTPESGKKSILYSNSADFWSTNAGWNVESGHAFTVNTDSVILSETGLTIDDIVLSQSGLNIGDSVSISSSAITLGTVDSVVLNADGLSVGNSLSLDTTNGLSIAGVVQLSSQSLTIGVTNPVVLDAGGLSVGNSLSLSTADGLRAGDISLSSGNGLVVGTGSSALVLDSTGLFVGDSIELSNASGLILDGVTLNTNSLTFSDVTGDVIMDNSGIYIGNDVSITKTGLNLGGSAAIGATSISFGSAPDDTLLDDTSLRLGEDMLLNHDGLYFKSTTSAVYMGDQSQWKISFESSTQNLKFQFYDSGLNSYVTKMEVKST